MGEKEREGEEIEWTIEGEKEIERERENERGTMFDK